MNRRLLTALVASVLVLAACGGGGAKTKSGFALGDEAFTLPAIPVTVVNDTRRSSVAYDGYAIVAGQATETLYRLPATADGATVKLGSCTPSCDPLGFVDGALILRGLFSESDAAANVEFELITISTGIFGSVISLPFGGGRAETQVCTDMGCEPKLQLGAASSVGFLFYDEDEAKFSIIGNGMSTGIDLPKTRLIDLVVVGESAYAIEATPSGERNLLRIFTLTPEGGIGWSADLTTWGSPISAERYGDGTRCDGGICAVAQSGKSLYIAFGSGEIVAYDTETGKEQEVPAPYQLADGFVATSFFWVDSSEILILAEGDAGWLVVRKIPGVWNPSKISAGTLLTAPTPALSRGGQTAYVVAQSTGEGDVALSLNTGGDSVEYPVYEVVGDGSTEREKIDVDLTVGLASFGSSTPYRTVAVDTQGRLFSLAGSAAYLIETPERVVDLIALGEILFVGQTGTDGLIHYSPLLKVGRSDESAADERSRARALARARDLAAATTVDGGRSIFDYLLPNGRLNEQEPAFYGRSH